MYCQMPSELEKIRAQAGIGWCLLCVVCEWVCAEGGEIGITFSCHGFITKSILAAEWRDEVYYPELQTWNSTDGITYMKQGATTFSVEGGNAEMTFYEYTPNTPHEFYNGYVVFTRVLRGCYRGIF